MAIETQIKELRKQISDMQELVAEVNNPVLRSNTPNSLSYWGGDAESVSFDPTAARQARAVQYVEGYKGCGAAEFKSFGDMLRQGYASKGSGEFRQRWMKPYEPVVKAVQGMSEQVGADGGFLVYPEFAKGILERVYQNNIWGQTDNYTVGGNSLTFTRNAETSRANGSRHGGVRGYWVGEGGQLTKSKPTFKNVSLRLKKLAVLVYLTDEVIEDTGTALEDYVTRCAAAEFNFMLGDAVFNATGAGQPLGFMNGGSLVSIAKESGQVADTIVAENIDKMWQRRAVNGSYQWYHNQDCCAQLDSLGFDVGQGGVPLYRQGNSIANPAPQTLKGARRTETEFNATVGDQGDIALCDFGQYLTISKGGISQDASIHVEFLTDQTAIRFIMRVDGRPWEDTAITPYKGTNTQSAYIVLDDRA